MTRPEIESVEASAYTIPTSAPEADIVEQVLASIVVGHDPMAVPGLWLSMVRGVRNTTRAGVAGYAISAVDVACWDLKARLLGIPLVDLFGAVHEDVPVYGRGGHRVLR